MLEKNALELSVLIKEKKISVEEVVSAYIELIEKKDKQYNSFITVTKKKALARARLVQSRINNGEALSNLAGIPIALKDSISTLGIETTCASKMLKNYVPVFNAAVVDRLENAGMIVIGKSNMDEFSIGSSSQTGMFSGVCNPWNVLRVAGGSSGGSAAAVAAGLAPLSLGSDTGGSIRQPCSFCGVTGIKPTYGAVSRYGLIACASSLDQIGPVGKNIDTCAALLSIISGNDGSNVTAPGDGTCVLKKPFEFNLRGGKLEKIKIGIPQNYLQSCIEDDVRLAVIAAAKEFEDAGAVIQEFEMPLMDFAVPVYYIICSAEISSNLSRYDGIKYGYRSASAKTLSGIYQLSRGEGFGLEVKKRIMQGSFVLAAENYDAYFKKAMQVRTLIKNAYSSLFDQFDIILCPATPTVAFKPGETHSIDPHIFTASVNLAGLPAAALPCGFDKQGLPIGLQLIGAPFSEANLVNAAHIFQNRTDHHTKSPAGEST